jgi:hypothetical protein
MSRATTANPKAAVLRVSARGASAGC